MHEFKVNFRRSSSAYYKAAITLAQKFDTFKEAQNSKEVNEITIASDELKNKSSFFADLWRTVSGWKGTEFYLDGDIVEYGDKTNIIETIVCCAGYNKAVIQGKYCMIHEEREGWGCKRLASICRETRSDSYYHRNSSWYEFGSFNSDKEWTIDKEAIKSLLTREAKLNYLELCPMFDLNHAMELVDSLPDGLTIEESGLWDITYSENINGNTIEKEPVGIRPKGTDHTFPGSGISISISGDDYENIDGDVSRHIPEITFDDIGGVDDILQMIREVIELPLVHPALIRHIGISPHKGILLYGSPGCGKTLIAKAVANEIDAHFISIGGPEILSKWFGESEENLRKTFQAARELAPSIIFFDEIDSIAQKRSGEGSEHHYSVIVNQLLTLMDGMETYENVCVIASTNRPDLLDAAILRPGRFDYIIEVKRPTSEGIRKILDIHTRGMPLSSSVNIDTIASQMDGLTGADIAFVAREGAYNCLRRCVSVADLIKKADGDINFEQFEIYQGDFIKALETIRAKGK